MDRRTFLQKGALGLFASSSIMPKLSFAKKSEQRPNIILIMADDIGSECFGSYGGLSYSTPALDGLAANGVRFDYCFAQPLCTPSRVKVMTGKYNFRNYKAFGILDPKGRTFGHLLQSAGYKTCVAGNGNCMEQKLMASGRERVRCHNRRDSMNIACGKLRKKAPAMPIL